MNRLSRSHRAPFHRRIPAAFASLVAIAALAAFATGCATNPVTGKKELSLVSESQEIEVGKQAKAAALQEYGYYEEGHWGAYVDSMGKALARRSHRPDLPWEFHLLDDPTVNAFCAPGGFVYITRGIMEHLNSEAQLAGVIGHEIGHATARHYARQASTQQLYGIGLGVGSIVSPTVARYSSVVQQGLGVLFLKYGRDQENEADRLGVQYSTASGWDSREMPATYQMLSRIGESAGSKTPTYLSTHPDPAAREATTRDLAAAATAGKTGLIVKHDAYVRSLDGMVYGNDPRNGYFEGSTFYHPDLRIQFNVPSGWQKQNAHTAVMAGDGHAVMQLTATNLGGKTPAQFVQSLVDQRQITGADGQSTRIGGYDAWLGRIGIQNSQGQTGTLIAAWIATGGQNGYQFLGQAASGSSQENAIVQSIRSFQPLQDAARQNPTPARLRVVPAPSGGTFASVLAGLGAQGVEPAQAAIMNGVELDDPVKKGQLIKVVRPAKVR
jgi:predicted Zn-dependent protease